MKRTIFGMFLYMVMFAVMACDGAATSAPSQPSNEPIPNNPIAPLFYVHDATHGISCWYGSSGVSCLPDSDLVTP